MIFEISGLMLKMSNNNAIDNRIKVIINLWIVIEKLDEFELDTFDDCFNSFGNFTLFFALKEIIVSSIVVPISLIV
jgi:hypothetical protein